MELLALTMLAKKISPLIVPEDTVRLSAIKDATRATPAKAKGRRRNNHRFEHFLQFEDPST